MAEDRNSLLQFLVRHYSLDGLKTLCFNLFVDYDNLAGDTKNAKARELILHLQRNGRLDDLRGVLARELPRAYSREFEKEPPLPPIPVRPNRDPHQVFISHAHEDDTFAHRLAKDLRSEGWSVWIAPDSIQPGETWVESINRGLDESSYFLLVLTPAAAASPWVTTETNVAISLEHQRKMRFLPLDVDPCQPPPLWTAYQNVPFRGNYKRGLEHLLARLNGRPPRQWMDGDKGREISAAKTFSDRRLHDRSRVEFVRIPPGDFVFGAADGDKRHEFEARSVHLKEYWIGRGPVTNAQFARFVEATHFQTTAEETGYARVWSSGRWVDVEKAYWRRPEGPRSNIDGRLHHPVVCISWFDAQAFCEWAGLRLPDEKEWEKAARGSDGRLYPWGDERPGKNRVNFAMHHGRTTAVGRFSPAGDSPFGVQDMAGNVWEWTVTWADAAQRARILRGGAWPSDERNLRATYRVDIDPLMRLNTVGFRVAARIGDAGF
jgi:formylglycine-generating enzyme